MASKPATASSVDPAEPVAWGAQPTSQRERFRLTGADGVRAIAALAVVFHHLYQRLNMPAQEEWLQEVQRFLMKGSLGVSAFFVLSGMLLSFPFWRAYLTKAAYPNIWHYIRRRAARIMPGFYAALLVSFWVSQSIFPETYDAVRRLWAGLTFTSGFNWVSFFPDEANGPLWSISFEVFSYVLMPLFMLGLFALKWRKAALAWGYWALALGVVLLINAWVTTADRFQPSQGGAFWGGEYGLASGGKYWMPEYNPVGFFAQFALGILAAGFIAHWLVARGGRKSWWFDLVALVATGGIVALLWVQRFTADPDLTLTFQDQPYNYPYFPGLVAILLASLAFSKLLGKLFDNPFARYTAKISFGIYIWHYLVLHLVERTTNTNFVYFGVDDPRQHLGLAAIVLGLSYAVAAVSWHVIEKPVLDGDWIRWTKAGWARVSRVARPAGG